MRRPEHFQPHAAYPIKLPEIISALSFALDLTEGADPGHAVRSTLLGMRLGMLLGLPTDLLASLYYALQLKDIGCSSNAERMAQLFGGDDRSAKAVSKLTDWTGLFSPFSGTGTARERALSFADGLRAVPRNTRLLWQVVLPEASRGERLRRLSQLGKDRERNLCEMLSLRCDRGAMILRKLRMSDSTCAAVRHLDEHWDGSGYPGGLQGEAIPLLARIAAVAQTLDVFATAQGVEEAVRTLQRRSGTWFDPELVKAASALHKQRLLWTDCEPGCTVETTRATAVSLSPETSVALHADQIDTICEAFADVVDAKSPFTFRHSLGVAEVAHALSGEIGLAAPQQQSLRRVGLLHDLGKLGISNSILDKPGQLTPAERQLVNEHPAMSRTILGRISGFEDLARIAGQHHERLDGTGYPDRLVGSDLSLESRLLSLSDCFTALAEDRPYRGPLPLPEVLAILRKDAPQKLDADLLCALEGLVQRWGDTLPAVFQPEEACSSCELPELTTSTPAMLAV